MNYCYYSFRWIGLYLESYPFFANLNCWAFGVSWTLSCLIGFIISRYFLYSRNGWAKKNYCQNERWIWRCVGIYNLSAKHVNGKAHWLQESGPNAIWSDKYFQNWKIGHVSNFGGSKCKMLTNRNTGRDLTTKAFPWKYYTKKWWMDWVWRYHNFQTM